MNNTTTMADDNQNVPAWNYESVEALIEISAFGPPVKYEIDEMTGCMKVDRFLEVSMQYPCNYGHIPGTIGGDGDAIDILIITPSPIQIGTYIACRPIGTLFMQDESGEDAKIVAVPITKVAPEYQNIQSLEDLQKIQPNLLPKIYHFFEHYKDLDEGKWVKLEKEWGDTDSAKKIILAGIQKFDEEFEETEH